MMAEAHGYMDSKALKEILEWNGKLKKWQEYAKSK